MGLLPQIGLTIFLLYGVIVGLVQSFGFVPAFNLYEWTLDYYRAFFAKGDWLASITFSLRIALVSAGLSLILGIGLVYLLLRQKRPNPLAMHVLEIPIIVPHVVVALFVLVLFSQTGLLSRLLYALGLEGAGEWMKGLTYDAHGNGITLAYLWKELPFVAYYLYAPLRAIDSRYGEAARTMGASAWSSFLRVTLPLCKQTILTAFLIIFMFSLGAYELPHLLGPTLPKTLPELAYIEYSHPDLHHRPYAMAINGLILLVGILVCLLAFAISQRQAFLRKVSRREEKA